MRPLYRTGTVFCLSLLLHACATAPTPIAPPATPSIAPTPTQTTTPTTPSPPATPKPTAQTFNTDWQTCSSLGDDFRTLKALETASYYVNVCQRGTEGRILYQAQAKANPNANILARAYVVNGGYQADRGTTAYRVRWGTSKTDLTIFEHGQQTLQEFAIAESGVAQLPSPQPPSPETGNGSPLTCMGSINKRNLYFAVTYTKVDGFRRFELRELGTDRRLSQGELAYRDKNDKGQPIYRGNAGEADVTVVGLAKGEQEPYSEISFAIDGQWGRGTCRRLN